MLFGNENLWNDRNIYFEENNTISTVYVRTLAASSYNY